VERKVFKTVHKSCDKYHLMIFH